MKALQPVSLHVMYAVRYLTVWSLSYVRGLQLDLCVATSQSPACADIRACGHDAPAFRPPLLLLDVLILRTISHEVSFPLLRLTLYVHDECPGEAQQSLLRSLRLPAMGPPICRTVQMDQRGATASCGAVPLYSSVCEVDVIGAV